MGYLRPTDGRTLCSRDCHRGRNPPSQEAGTDIWSDFGTPLRAPASGTVFEVGGSIFAATGYFVTIDLDDGRRIRFLHLWDRYVSRGQRVFRGTVFAQSGGSGYGSMYAAGGAGTVGRHVHVTLWPTHAYSFGTNANTLDFEKFADPIGSPASLDAPRVPTEEEELMSAAENIVNALTAKIDGLRQEVHDRRGVVIVWTPADGDTPRTAWVVDHGAGTKRNVHRGIDTLENALAYISWLNDQGIPTLEGDQAPARLAGYHDISAG